MTIIVVVVTELCFVHGFANVKKRKNTFYVILFLCFLKKINHAVK